MKRAYGFTIVELLIVIVVIAILAAISVASYVSIQDRATLTRQVADLDRIGKAIKLWSAENGKTLGQSGAGYNGQGLGGFTTKNNGAYGSVSVEDLLRGSGYLQGDITAFSVSTVMVAPCTNLTDSRWAVLAIVGPAPKKSAAEQIAETGCTNSYVTNYSGSGYNRNLIKAY